ncbi:hypothetical protein [Rhodovibrio sodomensis]|uniref:hypothetical protein n=1 Tax=Rhodovibrio sodomensis TaxID=1088 RepID=UPI001903E42F|nr:hypothetical protein [Rhodovibrio sodomensis]
MRSVTDLLSGQMSLFKKLPFQEAPDPAASYAATLGIDDNPRHKFAIIKESACRRLLPEVLAWLDERDASEAEQERVLAELIRAADTEGYEFARNLERLAQWGEVNSELVEILESYGVIRYEIVRQMVTAWVKANDIHLDLDVGTRVRDLQRSASRERARELGRPALEELPERLGTIVDLRPETAEYVVQFDEERARFKDTKGGQIVTHTRVQRLDS